MFRPKGLFKDVSCPGKHECTLPNCLFKHDDTSSLKDQSAATHVYDPMSVPLEADSPPPAKRRKVEIRPSEVTPTIKPPVTSNHNPGGVSTSGSGPTSGELSRNLSAVQINGIQPESPNEASTTARRKPIVVTASVPAKRLHSVTRQVSPPILEHKIEKDSPPAKPSRKPIKLEDYKPRKVEKSPALFAKRFEYIEKLKKMITDANVRMRKEFPDDPDLLLNVEEVKMQAMDEEEQAANANPNIDSYKMALGQRLMYFSNKKMTPAEWKKFIDTTWQIKPEANPDDAREPSKIKSGLDSVEKEITILKLLRCGLSQYQNHGYITKQPTQKEIDSAAKTIKTLANTEICDRCTTRFQVFPGRTSSTTADLTTRGQCRYHWARLRGPATRNPIYPCCGATQGSPGCTTSPTHVFKVSEDAARLALTLPFEETPPHRPTTKPLPPIVFDCEMAYTTHGMELIRLTALTWPHHTTVLDILVRPIGEILDLNTRFSGVSPQLFTSAPTFGHVPPPRYTPGEPLQLVASPAAARSLLFDHLSPETPLIGHAINNDLNACRIIHPFVIDTVLLYPHPKGLPVRYKLKDLASMYLGKKIQQGGAEGHDSKEDSEATGELVLAVVGRRWEGMKEEGWTWRGEKLIPPVRRVVGSAGVGLGSGNSSNAPR